MNSCRNLIRKFLLGSTNLLRDQLVVAKANIRGQAGLVAMTTEMLNPVASNAGGWMLCCCKCGFICPSWIRRRLWIDSCHWLGLVLAYDSYSNSFNIQMLLKTHFRLKLTVRSIVRFWYLFVRALNIYRVYSFGGYDLYG